MRKAIKLGIAFVGVIILISCGSSEKVVSFKSKNEVNSDIKNAVEETKANVFMYVFNKTLEYDNITYRDGKLILKYLVLAEELNLDEWKIEEKNKEIWGRDLEGDLIQIGEKLRIGNKEYIRVPKGKIKINKEGDAVYRKGTRKVKLKIKEIETEFLEGECIDEKRGYEVKFLKENKTLEEIEKSRKENVYFSTYDKNKDALLMLESEENNKIKNEIKEIRDVKEVFVSKPMRRIKGTDSYSVIEYMYFTKGEKDYTYETVIYDNESNEHYMFKNKENKYEFLYSRNKIMGIDKEGNLVEFKLSNGIIKTKEEFKEKIKFSEDDKELNFKVIYNDDNYIYVYNTARVESAIENKGVREVLYSYDLNSEKINIIGDNEYSDNLFIESFGVDDKIIFANKDGAHIGRLSGDKIEILVKNILFNRRSLVLYGKEYVVILEVIPDPQNDDDTKQIKVYKVK